jgi:hypothetical protein
LAHFLVDVSNLDEVFRKFLSNRKNNILKHPYFSKLEDITKEKLIENLDNKFKLCDYKKSN